MPGAEPEFVVARDTARASARNASKMVLTVDWPSSSGRSRSTAIASALGADPSSLLIDGLLLIPPLSIMNGPAAASAPTISNPSAFRAAGRGELERPPKR